MTQTIAATAKPRLVPSTIEDIRSDGVVRGEKRGETILFYLGVANRKDCAALFRLRRAVVGLITTIPPPSIETHRRWIAMHFQPRVKSGGRWLLDVERE